MYTFKDLCDMSPAELQKELNKNRQELFELQVTVHSGKEKDSSKLGKLKRYIAQILTVLNTPEGQLPAKAEATKSQTPKKAARGTKANK